VGKIKNPFFPSEDAPLPELVGQDCILEQAHVLLGQVRAAWLEKSLLFELDRLVRAGQVTIRAEGWFHSMMTPKVPVVIIAERTWLTYI